MAQQLYIDLGKGMICCSLLVSCVVWEHWEAAQPAAIRDHAFVDACQASQYYRPGAFAFVSCDSPYL